MSLVLKGKACILAARNAYDLIYTQNDTDKAVECLSALQEDAKQLQIVAEENKEKSAAKEQELEKEIVRLTKEKDSYDLTVSRLNKERKDEEHKLSQQRQRLSNAGSDLRGAQIMLSEAEIELSRAKEKERAICEAVGVAVSVLTFGIAGKAEVAAMVSMLEGSVNRAKENIRLRENDIERAQSAVCRTEQAISDIQRRISDYNKWIANNERSLKEVHDKISENKPTLAVHRQAVELWELFAQNSVNAAETSQRLEKIIHKANEKKNLKIIRSNGTVTIAKSVVEAWEEISFNQGRITSE